MKVNLLYLGWLRDPGLLSQTDRCRLRELTMAEKNQSAPWVLSWENIPNKDKRAYAILGPSGPAGIAGWDGMNEDADPSWWISSGFRGRGYGKATVDALANAMKREGVRQIRYPVSVQPSDEASRVAACKCVRRLRSYFPPHPDISGKEAPCA